MSAPQLRQSELARAFWMLWSEPRSCGRRWAGMCWRGIRRRPAAFHELRQTVAERARTLLEFMASANGGNGRVDG